MEHGADEFDSGRLVWILLLKMHNQSECAVFEWSIRGANNHGIPRVIVSVVSPGLRISSHTMSLHCRIWERQIRQLEDRFAFAVAISIGLVPS